MNTLHELSEQILPALEGVAATLREQTPDVEVEVMSSGGGGGSWHVLSLACYPLKDELLHRVSLQIDVCGLCSSPTLQVLVWWDHYLDYEFELFPEPVPASGEAVRKIKSSLPLLTDALKEAVRRGRPRADNNQRST